MDKPKQAICACGNSYMGDKHYYAKKYCDKCGRWLHWDRHSNIDIQDNQYQSDINVRDYREEEWA